MVTRAVRISTGLETGMDEMAPHKRSTTSATAGSLTPCVAGSIRILPTPSWDTKRTLQQLYLRISDQQPLDAVDMMKFDTGKTDIR